ncbi:MAG: hypothetical protein A2075_07470 [Geobacteraceae bacterium GWC2_58_44]|nr:MAG: hypothetical protein A2075_07470 [Geobacteraceae bacterium GWC2_58_44]HBG07448.1 hypothetical protein [Geobacter sp.]
MKKFYLLLVLSLTVISGCAASSELLKTGTGSIRSDVFVETSNGGMIPRGYADLNIVSSLKTHKPGIYPFEKKSHGTADYNLLVNIDGQALQFQGELQKESTPRELEDPEAGDGIRYRFSKKLRLKAGSHNVMVALPDDGIAIERNITLSDRSDNVLVVAPVYGASSDKQRPGFYGLTSFNEGVKGLRPALNGQEL